MSSVAEIPHQDNNLKKSFHRRNDSGELDVFEAARYFSDYNNDDTSSFSQKTTREDYNRAWWRSGGRISLDMPILRHVINYQNPTRHPFNDRSDQVENKDKTSKSLLKQPSSPGGRLASFLNSLFNQSASKKKKKKNKSNQSSLSTSTKDDQLEDQSPGGGRRKRRNSISHFRSSISSAAGELSVKMPSSGPGFRTPPAYAETPTKGYRDLKSFGNKQNPNNNNIATALGSNVVEKKVETFRKFDDDDDDDNGGDSDSSSDLFELPNYDLLTGWYSSNSSSGGLPVYETTNMDSIKRGPPISTA